MNNKLSLLVNFVGVDKMSGALRNIIGLGGKGSKSLRALAGDAKKLTREIADYDRQIQRTSGNATDLIDRQRRAMEQLEQVQRRIAREQRLAAIEADRQAMQRRGAELRSSGTESMIGAGAAAIPLISSARAAMTFEAAMADVRKVVDFPTPKAFAQMSNDILSLSTRIPMAAEGIAAIVAAGGRANIPRAELLRFAEDSAKMGVAFDITGDEAGAMMAKWRTAFSMGQADVVRLSNQVNALTNTYGGSALAVSGVLTRIGSLGKVSGVAGAQVASLAQLLNSVGVEEEVAATGIKNMMLAMTKGKSATKSQTAVLQSLGLSATGLAERMQKDAGGAITDLLTRISRAPKAAQAGMLSDLFGSESIGAIAPLLTNLNKLQANFALVGNKAAYAGSMETEYLSAIATTQGATGLALNSLKALNIQLGQALLPNITSVARWLSTTTAAVIEWTRANPGLTNGIVQTAAYLVGFRLAWGAAKFAIGSIFGPISTVIALSRKAAPVLGLLRTAFLFLGRGALQAGIMMMANPIVLAIVAVVAAIGVAAYLIYTNWDRIKATFKAGWAFLTAGWTAFKNWISSVGGNLMDGIINGLKAGWSGLKSVWNTIVSYLPASMRKKWEIHSPSRVFMRMGGNVADGLALGVDRGAPRAQASMSRLAGGVMAAGAMSLTPFAAAARPAAAPAGAASATAAPIVIHVHAGPGMDTKELARQVREEIETAQARRRRSGYEDA